MKRVKKWPDGEMLCAAFRNGGKNLAYDKLEVRRERGPSGKL